MGGLVVARRQGYATPYPPACPPTHLTCSWAQAGGIAAPVQIRASRGCHRSWHRFNRCGQPTHLRHHGAEVVDAPARCHRSLAGARTHKDQRSTEQEVEAVPPGCPPELAAPGLQVDHVTTISVVGHLSKSKRPPDISQVSAACIPCVRCLSPMSAEYLPCPLVAPRQGRRRRRKRRRAGLCPLILPHVSQKGAMS